MRGLLLKQADPEKLGFSTDRLARIDDLMNRYVDDSKVAGIVSLVARQGEIAYFDKCGFQDVETKTPMALDSIFRIYSMTKPITSVAMMMLYEKSLFNLTDALGDIIPAFKDVKVWGAGGVLETPHRPITIQDLFRHTAGLSYGDYAVSQAPVDELYDDADLFNRSITIEEMTERIASLPLMYHPGSRWHYSVATDIAGRLVEVISGMPLADYLQENIFIPMGMVDTAFIIDPTKLSRFCTLYGKTADSDFSILDAPDTSEYLPPVRLHSGGSGLVSTTADYLQFCQCILNKGELNGVRLLSPKTVELMTYNHLPPDLIPIAFEGIEPMFGMGFGLGFSVMLDMAQAGILGSVGDLSWGGYAETYFWIDPQEKLIAILMTQYLPSLTFPIRKEFRTAVYQALIK